MKPLLHCILVAVVLGGMVWFGVPVVKARVEPSADGVRQGSATFGGNQELSPEGDRQPSMAAESHRQPVAPPVAAPKAASAVPAAPQTVVVEEYAPGQEPRQPDYTGPRYDWGVLAREAQAFTEDGQPRVKLPGGTVVEKMSERRTKTGDKLLVCRIRNNRRWQEGFLFHAADVVQFQGPFAFAPKKPSDQIVDYFTKLDQREKRMAAIREEHLRKNPNFESYQEAARAYKELQSRAKELTAQRDRAVGNERSRLIRELEDMKSREPRLRAEFEKAEIAYKQWKKQHGDGTDAIGADPIVTKLDGEIDELYYAVADMVPGL